MPDIHRYEKTVDWDKAEAGATCAKCISKILPDVVRKHYINTHITQTRLFAIDFDHWKHCLRDPSTNNARVVLQHFCRCCA